MPIIGAKLDGDGLLQRFEPALDAVWPNRPQEVADLEESLRET